MKPENHDTWPRWRKPSAADLPGPDATLEEIIRFARSTAPTEHFAALWGDEYPAKARALWTRCVEAHMAGALPPAPPGELLLCLDYDLALGPHLGVPEPDKLHFLRWLIEGIRVA